MIINMKKIISILMVSLFALGHMAYAQENMLDQQIVNIQEKSKIEITKDSIKGNVVLDNKTSNPLDYGFVLVLEKMNEGKFEFIDQYLVNNQILMPGENNLGINYTLPDFIKSGDYWVSLRVVNKSGIPVIRALTLAAGNIAENKTSQFNTLDGSKCYMSIEGDNSQKKYGLLEGPDISKTETLNLSCDTKNSIPDGQYQLNYTTTNRSYGAEPVNFSEKENITIKNNTLKIDIKGDQNPQAYDYVFYLSKNEKRVTPVIQAHYVIQGESATIQGLNYENKNKDSIVIKLDMTGSSTNFPEARAATSTQSNNIVFTLLDANNNIVTQQTKVINTSNGEIQKIESDNIEIANLTDTVKTLKVEILSSDASTVIASNTIPFVPTMVTSSNNNMILTVAALIVIILILIYGVFFYKKGQHVHTSIIITIIGSSVVLLTAYAYDISASRNLGSTDYTGSLSGPSLSTSLATKKCFANYMTDVTLETNCYPFDNNQMSTISKPSNYNYVRIDLGGTNSRLRYSCSNSKARETNMTANYYLNGQNIGSSAIVSQGSSFYWSGNSDTYFSLDQLTQPNNTISVVYNYVTDGPAPDYYSSYDLGVVYTYSYADGRSTYNAIANSSKTAEHSYTLSKATAPVSSPAVNIYFSQ